MKLNMQIPSRGIIAACLTILPADALLAQSAITWQSPLTISSDADVSTDGSLVGAINNGGSSVFTISVNGVSFDQFATSGLQSVSVGVFTLATEYDLGLQGANFSAPSGVGISAEYSGLLTSSSYVEGPSSKMTLTIKNLAVGQLYQIQVWVNADAFLDPGGQHRSSIFTATNAVALRCNTSNSGAFPRGQFATGTFTASENSQTVTITGISDDPTSHIPRPLVTAVQLRALSGVPGPSKFANISTRARVDAGDNALIAGVILVGATSKAVIFRALGPSLAQVGVNGVLADPVLSVYDQSGSLEGVMNFCAD